MVRRSSRETFPLHHQFVTKEITALQVLSKIAFMHETMLGQRLHGGPVAPSSLRHVGEFWPWRGIGLSEPVRRRAGPIIRIVITLCVIWSCCRLGMAIDPGTQGLPNGASNLAAPSLNSPTPYSIPAAMALPVETGTTTASSDASTHRKFYTITASLRETYDDNVNTSSSNKISSLETSVSPSVLVDFPMTDSEFSARYTFSLIYYSRGGGQGGEGDTTQGSLQYTHEVNAQYRHSFSDRFNLNVAEDFRYFTEPSLFESVGTPYQSGTYIANLFSGTFSGQWTPLFSTTTTYGNTVIQYQDANVAEIQNSVENTASHSFNFAILPKISVSVGGIYDDISYDSISRGYTSYTAFVGGQWQALPSLSFSLRGGGSYTQAVQAQGIFSPYAAADINWTLGARSSLTFSYSHEIVPNDQEGTDGQVADRFSAGFRYDLTPRLNYHLQGIITNSNVSQSLIQQSSQLPSYNELDYGLDTGFTYHYNTYLDLDTGILLSGISSGLDGRDYDREELYVGIRGTY
jgi:hypothetical protein